MGQDASTTYISARVPVALAAALWRVAKMRDRSLSAELREAMRDHIAINDETEPAGRVVEGRIGMEPEHGEA